MRWPIEQPEQTAWKAWTLITVIVVLAAAGQEMYVRLKPLDPTVVRSEASFCRRAYVSARTRADTLKFDEGYWVVAKARWQRIPTCGELRLANLLHPPLSR
jgi:hypothetical protein